MAHVVHLILGAFISSIKVKLPDGHLPRAFNGGYILKVIRWDNGFHKRVERLMCQRSHTLALILQVHMQKFIGTNLYGLIPIHGGICTNSLFPIECAPM